MFGNSAACQRSLAPDATRRAHWTVAIGVGPERSSRGERKKFDRSYDCRVEQFLEETAYGLRVEVENLPDLRARISLHFELDDPPIMRRLVLQQSLPPFLGDGHVYRFRLGCGDAVIVLVRQIVDRDFSADVMLLRRQPATDFRLAPCCGPCRPGT